MSSALLCEFERKEYLMRKSRKEQLGETGMFHKMWRGHNREPVLESAEDKKNYLNSLKKAYTDVIRAGVLFCSYCIMSNHSHETGQALPDEHWEFTENIKKLGQWMRNGHSRFGALFNKLKGREGKVANDRPKTTQIDKDQSILTVMFYGDANPVRAGMVSHPSRFQYSSYNFYAFGMTNQYTDMLTPPQAYVDLGDSPAQRQAEYRSLCDDYLREHGFIDDRPPEGFQILNDSPNQPQETSLIDEKPPP